MIDVLRRIRFVCLVQCRIVINKVKILIKKIAKNISFFGKCCKNKDYHFQKKTIGGFDESLCI